MSGVSTISGVSSTMTNGVSNSDSVVVENSVGILTPADFTRGLWFDVTDLSSLSLNGANIISITDKKQGVVVTQGTDAKRPVLASNQINGKNAAQFRDGSNQYLAAANTPFATYYTSGDFTSINVFKYVSGGANPSGLLIGFGTSLANIMSHLFPFVNLLNVYFDWGNAGGNGRIFVANPASGFKDTWVIMTCRKRASDGYQEIRLNGTLLIGEARAGTWTPSTALLEIGRITGTDIYQSSMDWAESIMPDQYLSDAQMNELANGYLSNKYALSWSNI